MSLWRDGLGDLGQVQVHRCGIASWQDECGSFAKRRTDGTEDIGRSGALICWRCRSRAASGPATGDLVLLADPRFVGEPDGWTASSGIRVPLWGSRQPAEGS